MDPNVQTGQQTQNGVGPAYPSAPVPSQQPPQQTFQQPVAPVTAQPAYAAQQPQQYAAQPQDVPQQPAASYAQPPVAPPPQYAPAPSQPVVAGGAPNSHPGSMATPQQKQANPNSTQNTLQIAEIRDGIVIMSDGSFRSVVMVKSINFDLMSGQEQESVEYAYQGFLNSLYFPVQIFIRSQKVDLQPYIAKLDKIRTEHDNMLLALLMDDYIDYIDQLAQQTNIMDKKFYLVIPYFPTATVQKALTQSTTFINGLTSLFRPKEDHVVINEDDLEKAKNELRNRVQAVLSGLLQCGIQGLPLDTQELIELYYDTYNPDTATRQQLKNFGDLSADVITKGQGMAPQPHLQRELQ
jgi:hypothetical protein